MAAYLVVPYENYMTWVLVVTFIKGVKSVEWASRRVLISKVKYIFTFLAVELPVGAWKCKFEPVNEANLPCV